MLIEVIIWFAVLIGLITIEAITADLVTVWFMPGAVICILLAALGVYVPIQVTVFLVLSAVLLVLSKTTFKKYLVKKTKEKTNLDLIINETGIVMEDISNIEAKGSVKVNFQIWTARAESDTDVIKAGDKVKIVALEGVKLICRKI